MFDKHNLNEALFKAYHYKSKAIYSVKNSMNINIIENLTEALKVTQLKNNTYWESKFLNDIAYFHLLSKNYSEAKKYIRKALKTYKSIPNIEK